jgi:thioredoxin-related protein
LFCAWILAWLAVAASAATPLTAARDFAADARIMTEKRLPMLVLFSRADCHWCEKVRREYLAPIAAERMPRTLLREVDIDAETPMTDFSGQATTHHAFAARMGVTLAPTLIVFGSDGRVLADPLVGYQLPDFYATLIDRAIDDARNLYWRHAP